jgi:hypothetical protein
MSDLRQRFDRLDEVAASDLWSEIERRADHYGPAVRAVRIDPVAVAGIRLGQPRQIRWTPFGNRAVALAVVALLVAMLALIVSVGAFIRDDRVVVVTPSLAPNQSAAPITACPGNATIDAPATGVGWDPGRAPGTSGTASAAQLLVEVRQPMAGTTRRGESQLTRLDYVLLDVTGTQPACRLLQTPGGSEVPVWVPGDAEAAWSSGGDALAIRVEGNLGVWSARGYVPIDLGAGRSYPGMAWSRAGSILAVGLDTTYFRPHANESISLVGSDGTSPRDVVIPGCGLCVTRPVGFSPDDTRLAANIRVEERGQEPRHAIAIVDAASATASVVDLGTTQAEALGWRDDQTLIAIEDGQRIVGIPLASPTSAQALFTLEWPLGEPISIPLDRTGAVDILGLPSLSPDADTFAYWRTRYRGGSQPGTTTTRLHVVDLAAGSDRVILDRGVARNLVWSPDSERVAYSEAVDPQRGEAGFRLWVSRLDGTDEAIAQNCVPLAWRPTWP